MLLSFVSLTLRLILQLPRGLDSPGKSVILSALLRVRSVLWFEIEKDCLMLTS